MSRAPSRGCQPGLNARLVCYLAGATETGAEMTGVPKGTVIGLS